MSDHTQVVPGGPRFAAGVTSRNSRNPACLTGRGCRTATRSPGHRVLARRLWKLSAFTVFSSVRRTRPAEDQSPKEVEGAPAAWVRQERPMTTRSSSTAATTTGSPPTPTGTSSFTVTTISVCSTAAARSGSSKVANSSPKCRPAAQRHMSPRSLTRRSVPSATKSFQPSAPRI